MTLVAVAGSSRKRHLLARLLDLLGLLGAAIRVSATIALVDGVDALPQKFARLVGIISRTVSN